MRDDVLPVEPLAEMDCLAIEKRNSVDFVARVLATYDTRKVVVPVAGEVPSVLRPFVTTDRLVPGQGGGWFSERVEPRHDLAPAHVSLTSGTTGEPKPILLSHRALGDVTTRLTEVMQIDESVREYVGVPVTFSFGLARARVIAANGGAAFIPSNGFRVDELATMLARGEVNALSAVPTLLRLVLNERDRFAKVADDLRWIEIGSQPMLASEKAALRALFPNARIVQHYGLTEASRSTFLVVSDASSEELASVGRPTGTVEIKTTADDRIAIRGPHLADGIIVADGLLPIADHEGWLLTQDLGRLVDGNLFFQGRADDLINVGGLKIHADQFETELRRRLPEGADVGVAAGQDALRGQTVIVAYEDAQSEAGLAQLGTAASETARELGIADAFTLQAMPTIPRTDTGKVRRFEIAEHFDRQSSLEEPDTPAADDPSTPTDVQQAFLKVFGSRASDRSKSFDSLGGDSLNYVSMLTALEHAIPNLPDDWDRLPIERLEAVAQPLPATEAGEGPVEAAFASVFGDSRIEEGASFYSLGGDSLNYVQMLTALERVIPDLPDDWASLSIADLSGLAGKRDDSQPQKSLRQYIPTNLATVRGLACALVVALHIVGTQPTEGLKLPMSSQWHFSMDVLDLIRMPLFTAMAGFLYAAMPAARDGFGPFMLRKARQLLIPLLFATLVFWGLRQVTYGRHDSLVAAYVIGYQHLWYLDALLLMFAVVSFADLRLGERPKTWAVILAIVIVAAAVLPNIRILHMKLALTLLPYFILGMLLYRVPPLLRSTPLLAVSTLAIVSILTLRIFDAGLFRIPTVALPLALICGAGSVIFFLRAFPRIPLVERIAPYSFTIYLWHPAANAVVRNSLWKLGLHSTPIQFCIGMASGILIPIALHRIMVRLPSYMSAPVIAR